MNYENPVAPSDFLGLDVGSTFIKTGRLSGGQLQVETFYRTRMPDFLSARFIGSNWISPQTLFQTIDKAIDNDSAKHGKPAQIFISGQMHGATLCKNKAITPLVPISTWQDRAARDFNQGRRWHEVNAALNDDLRNTTGNELDFGHPLVVLPFLLAELDDRPQSVRFTSLISLVAEYLVKHPVVAHVSDAAASGMYDPFRGEWVPALVELAQISSARLPKTSKEVVIAGHTPDETPVYLGVGDHQASLLGGESLVVDSEDEICINVGTGAQVSSLRPNLTGRHRLRPKLGGGFFATIADLPAGRELSTHQLNFAQAAQAYRAAAEAIHSGVIDSVALTGSIFASAPEFTEAIREAFQAPTRLTPAEPALSGLARLAN